MGVILNEAKLHDVLEEIDLGIDKLNDQKITAFLDFLGLKDPQDLPENFLEWKTILIVLPDRKALQQLRAYKTLISRITFITNTNAKQIHIYDLNDWKNATQNKTALQIRQFLKTNFGGAAKISKNPDWIKLK